MIRIFDFDAVLIRLRPLLEIFFFSSPEETDLYAAPRLNLDFQIL
jgi:hypothetical protein